MPGARSDEDRDVGRLRQHQSALAELVALAGADDCDALADVAVHRLRAILDLQCCAAFEGDGDDLVLWASAGGALEPPETTGGAGETRVGSGSAVPLVGREVPRGLLTAVPHPGDVLDPDERRFLRAVADVLGAALDRRRVEADLRYRALHDPLTGLPNRMLLADRCAVAVASAGRQPARVALLCLDLDRFKRVNDTSGQRAGDALLRAVADRLTAVVRPGDTVARLGGDVFAVLCTVDRPARARALAERLLAELRAPFPVGAHSLVVTASVGVAVAPPRGGDVDRLLRAADVAMHRAKECGTDRVEVHPAVVARAPRTQDVETALRRAIGGDALQLEYQPVRRSADGALVGVEALVRWPSPDGTLRAPAAFVPLAEATGLVVPMGEWVLRTACREALQWTSPGGPRAPDLAVNLSARQLAEPDLVERVAEIVTETGFPPSRLVLEVTETAFLRDPQAAIGRLRRLQGLGVAIAIDDFGTGWSSLGSLRRLPVNTLKIDRTFVAGLVDGRDGRAFVTAILHLASDLGLGVVAEGVETDAQLRVLRGMGCAQVQGYLLGRPGTADRVRRLLHGSSSTYARLSAAGAGPPSG